jgi:hypothetical protein
MLGFRSGIPASEAVWATQATLLTRSDPGLDKFDASLTLD